MYLFFGSIVPIITHGYFWNEFLRIVMIFIAASLSFYSEIHSVIRNTVRESN